MTMTLEEIANALNGCQVQDRAQYLRMAKSLGVEFVVTCADWRPVTLCQSQEHAIEERRFNMRLEDVSDDHLKYADDSDEIWGGRGAGEGINRIDSDIEHWSDYEEEED